MNTETALAAIMGVITILAGIVYVQTALMGVTERATFKKHAVPKRASIFLIGLHTIIGIIFIAMGVSFFYEYDVIAALVG